MISDIELKLIVHDTIRNILTHPDKCGITSNDMAFGFTLGVYSLEDRLASLLAPLSIPEEEDKEEETNEDA